MEFKSTIFLIIMLLLNSPRALSYRPMAPSPAPVSQISEPPLSYFTDSPFHTFGAPAPAPDTMSMASTEFEDSSAGPTGSASTDSTDFSSGGDLTPSTRRFFAPGGQDSFTSTGESFPTSSSLSSINTSSSSSSWSSSSRSSSSTALKLEIGSLLSLSGGAISKLKGSSGGSDQVCFDILSSARDDLQQALGALQSNDMSLLKSMLSGVTTDLKTCEDSYKETGEESPLDTETIEKLRKSAGNCLDFTSGIKP